MKNNKLVLGHPSIDHHHDEVFDLDQKLDKAIIENNSKYIDTIVDFLRHYVKDHFNEEETLMTQHSFDGLEEHQKEHAFFKRRFIEIDHMYQQNHHITHLVFKIRKFIDTLIEHIIEVDSKMAYLIQSEGESQ